MPRPSSGRTPSTSNVFAVTKPTPIRIGSPSPVRFCCAEFQLAIAVRVFDMVRKSITSAFASQVLSKLIHRVNSWTRRSGSEYGSGVMSTALTTLKMADVAPMPNARVSSAAAAKPGLLISPRIAPVMSCRRLSNMCRPLACCIGRQRRNQGWYDPLPAHENCCRPGPVVPRERANLSTVADPPDHEDGGAAEHPGDGSRPGAGDLVRRRVGEPRGPGRVPARLRIGRVGRGVVPQKRRLHRHAWRHR